MFWFASSFFFFFLLRKLLSALISFHGDVSLKMKGRDKKGNEGGQLAVCGLCQICVTVKKDNFWCWCEEIILGLGSVNLDIAFVFVGTHNTRTSRCPKVMI